MARPNSGSLWSPSPCPGNSGAVIANLEHRHSYVRKNAVLALNAIYKLPKGELLVPDAPEVVEKLLQVAADGARGLAGGGHRPARPHPSKDQG